MIFRSSNCWLIIFECCCFIWFTHYSGMINDENLSISMEFWFGHWKWTVSILVGIIGFFWMELFCNSIGDNGWSNWRCPQFKVYLSLRKLSSKWVICTCKQKGIFSKGVLWYISISSICIERITQLPKYSVWNQICRIVTCIESFLAHCESGKEKGEINGKINRSAFPKAVDASWPNSWSLAVMKLEHKNPINGLCGWPRLPASLRSSYYCSPEWLMLVMGYNGRHKLYL